MIAECTIIKEIAQGGQKKVFLASHPSLGNVVIKRGQIKSFISLERIKREVELLSTLSSQYYPRQHHFNIDVTRMEFEIVEEYIEGETLRQASANFRDPRRIFELLDKLLEGLSIIWRKNIVHRDLKPENIIIRPDGKPCIIDLGIARFLDLDALTKTISPMGPCTPIYAAVEQLTNTKNSIDIRTDFFSLGIISLELYLEIHPYDPTIVGNHLSLSIIDNIMQNIYAVETPDKVKEDSLVRLASKTLQKQPFQRFRTYEMLKDFIDSNL